MLTKSYIYKKLLTIPYIYSFIWLPSGDIVWIEIVNGTSFIRILFAKKRVVSMEAEGISQVCDNVVSESVVNTAASGNSDVEIFADSISECSNTLSGTSEV
jgi:hypothetical protein